jgi:hypothetical protein
MYKVRSHEPVHLLKELEYKVLVAVPENNIYRQQSTGTSPMPTPPNAFDHEYNYMVAGTGFKCPSLSYLASAPKLALMSRTQRK